jgi:3-hydroxyisobutyrate dehydrogenase
MTTELFGFIGLGSMGQPMARNTCENGHALLVHDIAGTADRAPKGAEIAQSNDEIARRAGVIALSLPTVKANRAVIEEIAQAGHAGTVVVDSCTIGPQAAIDNARILRAVGIGYIDSPISGMKFRAEEGTLTSMAAGSDEDFARARILIDGYSQTIHHVGREAGQGQRMKLINNSLYISSLVSVSEALAYGESGGLEIDHILEVINTCSAQSFVTSEVFPRCMTPNSPAPSGIEAHIIGKDLRLFVEDSKAMNTPSATISKAYETIAAFVDEDALQDQENLYAFVRDASNS